MLMDFIEYLVLQLEKLPDMHHFTVFIISSTCLHLTAREATLILPTSNLSDACISNY